MKFDSIIFDLDGTLSATHEGIYYCLDKVFKFYGVTPPSIEEWKKYIGPPLADSFLSVGIPPCEVPAAIKLYQKHYASDGQFMCKAFDGIKELLDNLTKNGAKCFVATTKETGAAKIVLNHLGILKYFDYVAGSTVDQTLVEKEDIIAHLFTKARIEKPSAVMIGDKSYDIKGAKINDIASVGVLYGYGSREELTGATYIAATVKELKNYLLK